MKGDIGAAEFSSKASQETARLVAETTVYENERAQTVAHSKADLDVKTASFDAQVNIAKIEAQKAAQMRDAELQKEVEKKRAAVETERLRADQLAHAVVEAEKIKTIADAMAYEKQIQAEATLYDMQKTAEGNFLQFFLITMYQLVDQTRACMNRSSLHKAKRGRGCPKDLRGASKWFE